MIDDADFFGGTTDSSREDTSDFRDRMLGNQRRQSPVVRHNLTTHRAITACACGRTISLSDSGISTERCQCGRVWHFTGEALAMYEPKAWKTREREN